MSREARLALRHARLEYHRARLRYLAAAKAVEREVYRKDLPCHLRKQA
jgi:hypothetical protein